MEEEERRQGREAASEEVLSSAHLGHQSLHP